MLSLQVDSTKLVLFGHSVGGAVALHLAASTQSSEAKPAVVLVENTFTSIPEMAGPLMRRFGDWLPSQWKNNERIQEIACPILLLSGRKDTIVPPEMMDLLKCVASASAECKLVEFPEAGHNDVPQAEGYYDALKAFVAAHVGA